MIRHQMEDFVPASGIFYGDDLGGDAYGNFLGRTAINWQTDRRVHLSQFFFCKAFVFERRQQLLHLASPRPERETGAP